MTNVLDLPLELTINILLSLSLRDLASCQLTNSTLNAIIRSSAQIQYHLTKLIAGVEYSHPSDLTIQGHIERLRAAEYSWTQLKFDSTHTVHASVHGDNRMCLLQNIIDGINFQERTLNSPGQVTELCYFKLPSKPGEKVHPKRLDPFAHGLLHISVAVSDHDLIAVGTL